MIKTKKVGSETNRTYRSTKELLLQGEISPVDAGAALFTFGYELDLDGQSDAAEAVYRQTIELLETLTDQRDSQVKMSDLANLSFLHGQNLFELERFGAATASFRRCLELLEFNILLDASAPLIDKLGMTLNWLARSQRKSGNYVEAEKAYSRSVGVWRCLLKLSPRPDQAHNLRHSLATSLFGLAKTFDALGKTVDAEKCKAESEEIFQIYLRKEQDLGNA